MVDRQIDRRQEMFMRILEASDLMSFKEVLDRLLAVAREASGVQEAADNFVADQTRDVGHANAWVELTRTVDGAVAALITIADIGSEQLMADLDSSLLKAKLKALREKYGIADDMSGVSFAN